MGVSCWSLPFDHLIARKDPASECSWVATSEKRPESREVEDVDADAENHGRGRVAQSGCPDSPSRPLERGEGAVEANPFPSFNRSLTVARSRLFRLRRDVKVRDIARHRACSVAQPINRVRRAHARSPHQDTGADVFETPDVPEQLSYSVSGVNTLAMRVLTFESQHDTDSDDDYPLPRAGSPTAYRRAQPGGSSTAPTSENIDGERLDAAEARRRFGAATLAAQQRKDGGMCTSCLSASAPIDLSIPQAPQQSARLDDFPPPQSIRSVPTPTSARRRRPSSV